MQQQGWRARGALAPTAVAVTPGSKDGWYLRWSRARIQAWNWKRTLARTGGRIELAVDLGCGIGDWTARLTTIARRVIAVDIVPEFLTSVRALAPSAEVHCCDVRAFEAYDRADLVHLGGVMMYIEANEAVGLLSRVRERLAPGGVLQTRDWCAINLGRPSHQHRNGIESWHRTPRQYVDLARRAGLRLLELARSPSIYAEQTHTPAFLWRLAMAPVHRGSVSFLFARA